MEGDDEIKKDARMDVDLPSPKHDLTVANVTDVIVPKILESHSDPSTRVTTDVALPGSSTLAITMPQPALVPMAPSTLFSLSRTPEDEVSAGKEAMIQDELMNRCLKEAYDSSEVLKASIRVSAIVSSVCWTYFHSYILLWLSGL